MATRRRKIAPPEVATILIVEDDESIRLALRELLEVEGYEVVATTDGLEALDYLADTTPALVLTDLQMPNLDGVQLCERLRGDGRTEAVPIVVLSAARDLRGVEGRADAIVHKPFDIDALLSVIAQFIRPTVPPRPSMLMQTGRHHALDRSQMLVLYVTRGSPSCERAEHALRSVLESDLHAEARPQLEVVDVVADEDRTAKDGVAMTPTLVRFDHGHRQAFVGDLSDLKVLRAFLMHLD